MIQVADTHLGRGVGSTVGVILAWVGLNVAVVAEEPSFTANQSASIENATEGHPAEPPVVSPPEPTPTRVRFANRKPMLDVGAALGPGGSSPWYRTGLGALGIVLGLLGVLYWGLRKWVPAIKTTQPGAMTVVGRTVVTPKHSLAMVQWGRRFVLLGLSPDRMTTLGEIADTEEAAELAGRLGVRFPGGAAEFDDALMTETSAYQESPSPAAPTGGERTRAPRSTAVGDLLRRLRTLRSA